MICYHKFVENKSQLDVRDVSWQVADFYRNVIRKGDSQATCPPTPGEMKPTPTNGPLRFGPGSDTYDTTVFQPKSGWGQAASDQNEGNLGSVGMELAFDAINAAWVPTPVLLAFESEAKNGDNTSEIAYRIENKSDLPVSVLVNVSAGKSILAQVPFIQRALELPAHSLRYYPVTEYGRAGIELGLIVVYNSGGHISAINSAGFYTVKGIKERSDNFFGSSLFQPQCC